MPLLGQLARFASIGVIATLVHVTVAMLSAKALGLQPLVANFCGFAAAVTLSYFGQGRLTFQTELRHAFHGPRFLATALTGLVISSGITQVAVVWAGLPFALGMALVAVAVPLATYTLCRLWVFKPAH